MKNNLTIEVVDYGSPFKLNEKSYELNFEEIDIQKYNNKEILVLDSQNNKCSMQTLSPFGYCLFQKTKKIKPIKKEINITIDLNSQENTKEQLLDCTIAGIFVLSGFNINEFNDFLCRQILHSTLYFESSRWQVFIMIKQKISYLKIGMFHYPKFIGKDLLPFSNICIQKEKIGLGV